MRWVCLSLFHTKACLCQVPSKNTCLGMGSPPNLVTERKEQQHSSRVKTLCWREARSKLIRCYSCLSQSRKMPAAGVRASSATERRLGWDSGCVPQLPPPISAGWCKHLAEWCFAVCLSVYLPPICGLFIFLFWLAAYLVIHSFKTKKWLSLYILHTLQNKEC